MKNNKGVVLAHGVAKTTNVSGVATITLPAAVSGTAAVVVTAPGYRVLTTKASK